ncbi:MAG: hypothetical protein K5871_12390 [Lachnospiraceae bacterium]|nr:hypothetical protein [Lachnospiraceae bacterium]
MKKLAGTVMMALLICMVAGCGENAAGHAPSLPSSSVEDVLEAGVNAADSGDQSSVASDEYERQSGVDEEAPEPEDVVIPPASDDDIDIDLTIMSSTVVYSQVYDMMVYPEDYIGMNIKMNGIYACTDTTNFDEFYCACIIQDATACCSQGIEFELTDDYAFPGDYPEYGDTVTVVGTFDIYKDGGYTYCTLRNARLIDEGP